MVYQRVSTKSLICKTKSRWVESARISDLIDFTGRVAIVTGAGRGLGRSYAIELARRGAAVIVNDPGVDSRGRGGDDSVSERVVGEITKAGGRAKANRQSVATRAGGEAIVADAIETFGRLDVIVNNAGVLLANLLADLSPEELEAHLDVHVKGSIYVTKPAFEVMKDQRYGRIVFVGSMVGMFGMAGLTAYAVAKGAIFGLANVVANEGAPYGVLANMIMPAGVTRMGNAWTAEERVKAGQPPIDHFSAEAIQHADHSVSTAAVTYLASETCALNHYVFSTAGGRIARVFVGVTPGWRKPDRPSADDFAAHLDEIVDRRRYDLPMTAMEENELAQALR